MKIEDLVKKYDPENQFDVLVNSYNQIEQTLNIKVNVDIKLTEGIRNIVIAGMGGSAIGGELVHDLFWDDFTVPIIIHRNYDLPKFANDNTLLIISSYSGNTEESISALNSGLESNCKIICMSTGGEIEVIAKENNLPFVRLNKGYQPRYALWINFFTLIKILQLTKLIPDQNDFINTAIILLKNKGDELSKDNNMAFKIAESLVGFIPVIYSVNNFTSAVGNRLKCQFNENSKLHSFYNTLPELNHNEIIGWETFNDNQFNCKVIFVNYDYNSRVVKRFQVTSELLNKIKVEVIELKSDQKDIKLKILDLIYLGDWISYYLAILRGYDPSEIDNIHYLKKQLAESNV